MDVYLFTKGQQTFVERSSADSFECYRAIGANRADADDPRGVFDEPRHHGVVNGDLALNPLLKVELIRADDTRDLLDRGFYFSIGCVVVCIWVLLHDLVQLFDLETRFSQGVFKQLWNRCLIVGSQ